MTEIYSASTLKAMLDRMVRFAHLAHVAYQRELQREDGGYDPGPRLDHACYLVDARILRERLARQVARETRA
jgi:hypothetical protein